MSQQLLRKVPKQTSSNFIERQGIMRYTMHHSQRLKVKSFLCITKKLLKQVHEKLNNNQVICHNQN